MKYCVKPETWVSSKVKLKSRMDEVDHERSNLVKIVFEDHREKFVTGLWNLFKADRLLDIDFRLDGNGLSQRAHRLVLEALLGAEIIDRIQVGTSVHEPNEKLESCPDRANMESFLEFLYRGEVSVLEENLAGFFEIGHKLKLGMMLEQSFNEIELSSGSIDDRKAAMTNQPTVTARPRSRKSTIPRRIPSLPDGNLSKQWSTEIWFNSEIDSGDNRADSDEFDELTYNRDGYCQKQIGAQTKLPASEKGMTPLTSSTKLNKNYIAESIVAPAKEQSSFVTRFQWHNVMTSRCPPPPKVRLTSRPAILNCEYCEYQTRDETYLRMHTAVHEFPQRFVAREDSKEKATRARTIVNATNEPGDGVQEIEWVSNVAISVGLTPKSAPAVEQARNAVFANQHPPNVKARYRCDMCRKPFHSQNVLDRHNRAKHKVNKCPHCPPDKPYESDKVWRYAHHLFSVHQVNNRGDVIERKKCIVCDYTCRTDKLLRTHIMLKHCGERQYKCEELGCPYTSGRKGDLGRHIKVAHLGIKPYLCEYVWTLQKCKKAIMCVLQVSKNLLGR